MLYRIILVQDEQGYNVQPPESTQDGRRTITRASEHHNYAVSKDTAVMDLETGLTLGARP